MESQLASRRRKSDGSDAVLIVGKGKRSEDKPVLLPAILQLLQDEYGIVAVLDEQNSGRVRIPKDSIRGLVGRKKWKV